MNARFIRTVSVIYNILVQLGHPSYKAESKMIKVANDIYRQHFATTRTLGEFMAFVGVLIGIATRNLEDLDEQKEDLRSRKPKVN